MIKRFLNVQRIKHLFYNHILLCISKTNKNDLTHVTNSQHFLFLCKFDE